MLNPGIKIYEHRIQKGWTQAELASKAGIAQANLSNIEKGKRDFTVSTLIRIARALEVKPSVFLEEECSEKSFPLTRSQIESLAKAVVHQEVKASREIRDLAKLLRLVTLNSEKNSRTSSQKIQSAWNELRQKFSSDEIRGISKRIQDERLRTHA